MMTFDPKGPTLAILSQIEERGGFVSLAEFRALCLLKDPVSKTRNSWMSRLVENGHLTITVELTNKGADALKAVKAGGES